MKFDLIRCKKRNDTGTEFYSQLFNIKFNKYYWSLIQFCLSWNNDPGFPYLQITFGSNGFFSLLFWIYKFGVDIDICSRSWNWDYLKDIE